MMIEVYNCFRAMISCMLLPPFFMIRFPFLLWFFGSPLIAFFLHSYCSKSSLDDANMWVT
jgi:hypothetical protein